MADRSGWKAAGKTFYAGMQVNASHRDEQTKKLLQAEPA
jgi:hypothetical protein